jgi:hypothetical protein
MYLCVCSEGNQTPALLEDTLLYEEPQRARLRARFGKSVGWRKVLGQGNLLRDAKMEWGISDENWSSVAELIRAMSRGKREIRPDVVTKALSAMESRIRAKTNASGTSEGAIVSLRTADDDEAPHRCWNAVFALGRSKAAIAISQILAALAGCKSGILSISSASTLPEGHRNALLVITPPLTRQMQSLRKLRAKKFAGPILILADEILGDLQTQFSILRFGEGTQSVILPGFNLTELWCIATRLTPLMPTNLLRCNQELRETKRVLELKVSEHINRLSLCKTREEFANKLDGVIELVNTRTIASHTPVEIGNTRLPIKKHLYNAIDAVRSNDIDPAAIFPTIQLLLERWKDSAPE